MDPKWHIAFCNVTYTEYAGVTYRDYYSSPAIMLEAQLKAKDYVERRWSVGRFCWIGVDMPSCAFATLFGMEVLWPQEADEIPYLDTSHPPLQEIAQAHQLSYGDPRTTGWMARRYAFWRYFREQGYNVPLGGASGAIISTAMEITGNRVLEGLIADPDNAWRVLEKVLEAEEAVAKLSAELNGRPYTGFTYIGDDFAGLLSPRMFQKYAVSCYQRLYKENTARFMHSELLRAEHLRIAKEELGITDFHGAGCELLTLEEMHKIMGERFWTQLTPQEMLELTPGQIAERIKILANSGCWCVQLYPGRGTPEKNMEAALAACERECAGGPL